MVFLLLLYLGILIEEAEIKMNIDIKDRISEIVKYNNVREIYLFGSVARGDSDKYSDIDLLIVIDDCSENEYISLKNAFSKMMGIPASWISQYRISKVINMYEKGSYFLWHIKKEGVLLFTRNNQLPTLLLSLKKYNNVDDDLKEYHEIVFDIEKELSNKFLCEEYELAVLASLVRNTCIAIAYIDEKFEFGRYSAVEYCFLKYNIKVEISEFQKLYLFRLYQTGKVDAINKGDVGLINKWIAVEKELLEIAKERSQKNGEKSEN